MIGLFAIQYFSPTSALDRGAHRGDDARGDRPPGDQRPREQAPAGGSAHRPADRPREPRPPAGRPRRALRPGSGEGQATLCRSTSTASSATTTPSATRPATRLLVRLGRLLRHATDARGTAYRIGGDEFCLSAHLRRGARAKRHRRRAEALTLHGPGFEVSSSWGTVAIPSEADDSRRRPAARRRAHVRAEGVAAHRPRRGVADRPPRMARQVRLGAAEGNASSRASSASVTSARRRGKRATSIAASSSAPISR